MSVVDMDSRELSSLDVDPDNRRRSHLTRQPKMIVPGPQLTPRTRLFGIKVVILGPGAIKSEIWNKHLE